MTSTKATVIVSDMLKDAGRCIDGYGMVWMRRLKAPLKQISKAVSTTEGLPKWWLAGALLDAHGRPPAGSYPDDPMNFYVSYMTDHARWRELLKARREAANMTAG